MHTVAPRCLEIPREWVPNSLFVNGFEAKHDQGYLLSLIPAAISNPGCDDVGFATEEKKKSGWLAG